MDDLRALLKNVAGPLLSTVHNPFLPANVREAMGHLQQLLTAMVDRIEQLEKERAR